VVYKQTRTWIVQEFKRQRHANVSADFEVLWFTLRTDGEEEKEVEILSSEWPRKPGGVGGSELISHMLEPFTTDTYAIW
jgi:hypothetical protein